jgi:hypothetical protein
MDDLQSGAVQDPGELASVYESLESTAPAVLEAHLRDPDGRIVSLQAPLPEGVAAPDAETHHAQKYGHS